MRLTFHFPYGKIMQRLILFYYANRYGRYGDITSGTHMDLFLWWTAVTEKESQKLGMSCIGF